MRHPFGLSLFVGAFSLSSFLTDANADETAPHSDKAAPDTDKARPSATAPASGESASQESEESARMYTPHANVLGLSLAYQAPLSLDKQFAGGIGIVYTHEYFVARRTALGVHVGFRAFPGTPLHLALGYGLTFKHYLFHLGATEQSGLYVLYGLLLQMNWLKGAESSATGHDTRMAVGYDWDSRGVSPASRWAIISRRCVALIKTLCGGRTRRRWWACASKALRAFGAVTF